MNKILKHKKIIAFLLVFTLSFGIVSNYKQKDTQAFVIADDILFWTLGSLLVATGIVAVSNTQVLDMGSMVFEKIKFRGLDSSDILVGSKDIVEGLVITKDVIDSVSEVAESIVNYKSDKYVQDTVSKTVLSSPMFYKLPPVLEYSIGDEIVFGSVSFFGPGTYRVAGSKDGINIGSYDASTTVDANWSLVDSLKLVCKKYGTSSQAWYMTRVSDGSNIGVFDRNEPYMVFNFTGITGSIAGITSIPYVSVPSIKEQYNPTYTNERLNYDSETNDKKGYLPIPQSIPDVGDISTEFPLTWEDVKGNITTLPTDTDVPDTSVPDTDVPDTDVPDTSVPSIWSWLQSLLASILGVLSNIWEVISSLVSSLVDALTGLFTGLLEGIGELLSSLVNSITNALEFLFAPSIALEDAFKIPNGGFSQIVDFFNWDRLWSLEPKPYEFIKDITIFPNAIPSDENGKVVDSSRVWHVELKPFSISYVEEYLPIFRNVMSYSILITVVWAIIHHFLPKRNMD